MKRKLIITFCLFASFLLNVAPLVTVAQVNVSAQAASLMNADTGEMLFTKNADQVLPIASLTKIMTAIVAIESGDLNAQVPISTEAANQPPSSLPLQAGDSLTLEDLLYGLLLESGNDAAWAIAEYIGGNVDNFVKLMNQKAESLGLVNTKFSNPSGLSEPSPNYSTAREIAQLMRYAMQNDTFRRIASAKTYETTSKLGIPYRFDHKNRLVQQVDYVKAGKTGFTRASGRTLISYAEANNIPLIAVTLNAPDDWRDQLNMFKYGYSRYGIDVPTPEIRSSDSEK